ncbi:hypothetical protein F8M41_002190 [Gigaspora margarita]|uniref:Uncharacterized protein n=1 Tax=Gigaspora margarita TaxID=4874 RepID=A0A8H4A7I3_GIGMA|nr:hypothetical protein F8M41_002190 [Gigaspora margarita]
MFNDNKIELPTIKNTKVATHPHALRLIDYITRENLFDIMNKDLESFNKIDQHSKNEQAFDSLKSANHLNNKSQSIYNLHDNMNNVNKYTTKESLLDIMDEKSKSNHNIHNIHNIEQFDKPNQHPKMNLNSLLNDQESNDQDFYFCQSDNQNFENICHNDNVLLTKDVQYSEIELMPRFSIFYDGFNALSK